MENVKIILEVLVYTGNNWPHNTDRVQYGPFLTKSDAMEFFVGGVKRGMFSPNHRQTRCVNEPTYSKYYRESA